MTVLSPGEIKGGGTMTVNSPTVDLLTPIAKQHIQVGCWNVRVLYQTERLGQTVNKMKQYNLSLFSMSEERWTGIGKQRVNSVEVIIWSGRSDSNHHEGVALLINQTFANTVTQWKPMHEKLLYGRLNSRYPGFHCECLCTNRQRRRRN